MTEKRFKVEKQAFDGYCIVDSNIDGYYAYEKHDLRKLCDSLNKLVTKCNDLKKENEQLKQLVNIADDLIDKLGSETMQNEWIKNF